jgi:hypothetical protein
VGVAGLAAGLAATGWADAKADVPAGAPAGGVLRFRVRRRGSLIGTHQLDFAPTGAAGLVVRVAIDIRVGFGPIPLYRYRHRATETWAAGKLAALSTETSDNGSPLAMSATRDAAGLHVQGSKTAAYLAPEGAIGTTYWSTRTLDAPLINTEDGRLLKTSIASLGRRLVPTAAGADVLASGYTISGDLRLTLWYDTERHWASLRFLAHDGSIITYERF